MAATVRPRGESPAERRGPLVAEEADLRGKNQVTIPRRVARLLGLQPGDRLIFEVGEGEPDVLRIRRLRNDYAGALAGVYGTPEEARTYLREEREAWRD